MREPHAPPRALFWAGLHLAFVAVFVTLGLVCGDWVAGATIDWVARLRG